MQTPEIRTRGLPSGYEIEHLARIFFPGAKVRAGASTRGALVYARAGKRRLAVGLRCGGRLHLRCAAAPAGAKQAKQALSRLLYEVLREATGLRPPWGMLTGVRPVNLLRKTLAAGGEQAAKDHLLSHCDVSPAKYRLAWDICALQQPILQHSGPRSYSLYVSIPFCPSRCNYCSFVSRTTQREAHLITPYVDKLIEELAFTAELAAQCGLKLETIYVGGGTPTALDHQNLERLLAALAQHFNTAAVQEYTVEAGRPDCTDFEKLAMLKAHGVGRISINPQSMQNSVLAQIGRRHTAEDVLRCFADARRAGHGAINMDLIAGLPGDDEAGFAQSLEAVLALAPENITVHSLTLKRASNLVIDAQEVHASPTLMIAQAGQALGAAGYAPYYLYRQKNSPQNLENTGWARPGHAGLYNIYMMEEAQSILAVGAGAATKLVAGGGSTITRSYNHKLPADYILNFDTVIERKRGVKTFYARYLDTQTSG